MRHQLSPATFCLFLGLAAACAPPLEAGRRSADGDSLLQDFGCGQNGQVCCQGAEGAACMPGLSCNGEYCLAGFGDAGVTQPAQTSCGAFGEACCPLADGTLRCRDATLSCDGTTRTCVAATADELGGDSYAAPPRSSVKARPGHRDACVFVDNYIGDVVGVCARLTTASKCMGGTSPRPGACGAAPDNVMCCPWGTADAPNPTGPTTSTTPDTWRRASGQSCDFNGDRSINSSDQSAECTTSTSGRQCQSGRCLNAGSSTLCCIGAGTADGGSSTPSDVNRRGTGDSCDFTGNGVINSSDNAVCTADTSGRSCVSLRCLNAGHSVRCCRPRSGSTSSSSSSGSGIGSSCNQRQSDGSFKMGVCVSANASTGESSSCFDRTVGGLCPGPSTTRCCLD